MGSWALSEPSELTGMTTERGSEVASFESRHARVIDIVSAVLLALATVATAWSSYQATRWGGVQANSYGRASAARIESTRASTEAGQLRQIDVTVFAAWLDAYAQGQTELADFYQDRFRNEFRPAFDAWVATMPRTNPDAPKSPFAMPEYALDADARAAALVVEAEAFAGRALEANQRGDNYVLCVVMFAMALFFVGVSPRFRSVQVRLGLVGVAVIIFVGTAAWIGTFPVSFGI
jgi:hypothetical protein